VVRGRAPRVREGIAGLLHLRPSRSSATAPSSRSGRARPRRRSRSRRPRAR
jgi:hypothetical protein